MLGYKAGVKRGGVGVAQCLENEYLYFLVASAFASGFVNNRPTEDAPTNVMQKANHLERFKLRSIFASCSVGNDYA